MRRALFRCLFGSMVYGSIEAGFPQDAERNASVSARRTLLLAGGIALSCLALSGALMVSGRGELRTELSFTGHLDLDKGALGALENAAGATFGGTARRGSGGSAYSDAQPKVPAVLKARFNNLMARASGMAGGDDSEMLASFSGKEDKQAEARQGMRTSDYEEMTDAAGEE